VLAVGSGAESEPESVVPDASERPSGLALFGLMLSGGFVADISNDTRDSAQAGLVEGRV
jgi:hypothetical protein